MTADRVLLREAIYRAIGEGYTLEPVAKQVNFSAWYQNELRALLVVRLISTFAEQLSKSASCLSAQQKVVFVLLCPLCTAESCW